MRSILDVVSKAPYRAKIIVVVLLWSRLRRDGARCVRAALRPFESLGRVFRLLHSSVDRSHSCSVARDHVWRRLLSRGQVWGRKESHGQGRGHGPDPPRASVRRRPVFDHCCPLLEDPSFRPPVDVCGLRRVKRAPNEGRPQVDNPDEKRASYPVPRARYISESISKKGGAGGDGRIIHWTRRGGERPLVSLPHGAQTRQAQKEKKERFACSKKRMGTLRTFSGQAQHRRS